MFEACRILRQNTKINAVDMYFFSTNSCQFHFVSPGLKCPLGCSHCPTANFICGDFNETEPTYEKDSLSYKDASLYCQAKNETICEYAIDLPYSLNMSPQ